MANNYKTLTFSQTNQVWSADESGSAAYFNNTIYLFYPALPDPETSTTASLMYMTASASADLSLTGNWTGAMTFAAPFAASGKPPTPASTPSAVAADALYVFWCDKDEDCVACSAVGWTSSIKVLDAKGNRIDASNREVAACRVGTVILVTATDTGKNQIDYYTLSPADIDASGGTWKARGHVVIPQATLISTGSPMSKCTSIASTVAYRKGEVVTLLTQSLQFSKTYYLFVLQLDEQTNLPTQSLLKTVQIGEGQTGGMMLTRDPAGRVRYYFGDNSDARVKGGLVSFCNSGDFNITVSPPSSLFGDDKQTSTPPTAVFVPILIDGSGDTQRWTIREVVFHSANTSDPAAKFIKLQVADYGTLRRSNLPAQDLTTPVNRVQLLGYILSPPPLAAQNYTGKTSNYPFTAATLTYGQTNGQTQEAQTETGGSVGIGASVEAGAQFDVYGILQGEIKVEFEADMNIGWDSTVRTGSGATTTMELSAPWEVRCDADGQPEWQGQGFALFRNIVIQATTYDFIDNGQSDAATDAYAEVLFAAQDTSMQLAVFRTNLIDPNDFSTYTESGYTTKMTSAGLYSGNNYIQDIVAPNALAYDSHGAAFVATNAQKGLPFSWGGGASVQPEYTKVDTSFTESAWSLDTRIYAAVGADLHVLAGVSGTVWSDLKTSMRAVSSTTLEQSWGIKLSIEVPMAEMHGVDNPVYSYTGTLYFCPPPSERLPGNNWTTELVAALANGVADFDTAESRHVPWDPTGLLAKIDPSSECWKMCFTVANVVYGSSSTTELVTTGYLSETSAKQLTGQGLDTVHKVAQALGVQSLAQFEDAARTRFGRSA